MKKMQTINVRRIILVIVDAISIALAGFVSLLLRFNGHIEVMYLERYLHVILPVVLIGIGVFTIFRLYHSLWQFASIRELENIIFAVMITSVINIFVCGIMDCRMPRSCYFIYFLLLVFFVASTRFIYRILRIYRSRYNLVTPKGNIIERVMIIGAGEAGHKVFQEIRESVHINKEVCCFIDDDPIKWKNLLHGVVVYGGRDKILEAVEKYRIDTIYLAIPSLDRNEVADLLNICKDSKCQLMRIPGTYQLLNGDIHISDLKEVEIQDLLGREPIEVNLSQIMGYVENKVVMVTGGGGSIGSEICRQIAYAKAKQLIIVDIYENNAYDIQQELKVDYPDLDLVVLIASVRNTKKVNKLFEQYHPDIVYHAAAHKHVPLMEDSPNEAVKNNVFGTYNMVRAADKYGAQRFILISTDKAVNPTNVMGATKRLCEMLIQAYDKKSKTEYVAVRFGNVLGSNGSVIPLFKKQIQAGGPVTVTHPEITRYFMTIPEAVSLVLQAGAYANGGEIFVLDMGQSVKIVDMAKNLIKLSGYEPNVDIDIVFTGLRPGEKLYEELLMDEEGLKETPNHMIHIGQPINMDDEAFFQNLIELKDAAYSETDKMKELISHIVPTYTYKNKDE